MKLKFGLTNIFLQICIFCIALFTMLTQFSIMRQPIKLFIQTICILSMFSLIINIYNYVKEEKE